jgi:hypothetical protein
MAEILDFAQYKRNKKYTQNEVEYLAGISGTIGFISGTIFILSIYAVAWTLFYDRFSGPLAPPKP